MSERRPEKAGDEGDRLLSLISGFQISQALYVAVMLDLPDLLGDGQRSSDELAALAGCNAGALYRLMRALAAAGIFHESANHSFTLTPLGAGLRKGAARSQHAWISFALGPTHWSAWGEMLHGVMTGQTPFTHSHGQNVWAFRQANPAEGALFDLAMRERSSTIGQDLLCQYDFRRFGRIADIGGGDGGLLAALLSACPTITGLLFDRPHVVANAADVFREAGVSDRSDIAAGDFFKQVPPGFDAYLLKHILHDWEGPEALAILRSCRNAMTGRARLLIIERLLGSPNSGLECKLSDLNMLVNAGGRERPQEDFEALLREAGLSVTAVIPLSEPHHVIEAVPNS
jgi:hypothetical protein